MPKLLSQIKNNALPKHIAIIMDGNGRWAKQRQNERIYGHKNGVTAVRDITTTCAELGIEYLTLFAFSTENWARPELEIMALMNLLVETICNELPTLQENNIKLNTIGNIQTLPQHCQKQLALAIEDTKNNKSMTLTLALSYSSRWEITNAAKRMVQDVLAEKIMTNDITIELFEQYMSKIPDVSLLIRTSGELRLSNFLLWQCSYAELYFTPTLWPDFDKECLYAAIIEYQNRERRFGLTSEQIP